MSPRLSHSHLQRVTDLNSPVSTPLTPTLNISTDRRIGEVNTIHYLPIFSATGRPASNRFTSSFLWLRTVRKKRVFFLITIYTQAHLFEMNDSQVSENVKKTEPRQINRGRKVGIVVWTEFLIKDQLSSLFNISSR
jgi:hypothetical protein